MKIGIIIGSTREGNIGKEVGEWVFEQSKTRKDADYQLIEVSKFKLPMLGESNEKIGIEQWNQTISALDGFVFVAAEYNHSITGSLKNALDLAFDPWMNKAAGIVSYGYAGGARAAEHLRGILGALGVADVQQHVLINLNSDFDKQTLKPVSYQTGLLTKLFDQVERWSKGLKSVKN
jgi:NAD(P)H-dependent FMN reductase